MKFKIEDEFSELESLEEAADQIINKYNMAASTSDLASLTDECLDFVGDVKLLISKLMRTKQCVE